MGNTIYFRKRTSISSFATRHDSPNIDQTKSENYHKKSAKVRKTALTNFSPTRLTNVTQTKQNSHPTRAREKVSQSELISNGSRKSDSYHLVRLSRSTSCGQEIGPSIRGEFVAAQGSPKDSVTHTDTNTERKKRHGII